MKLHCRLKLSFSTKIKSVLSSKKRKKKIFWNMTQNAKFSLRAQFFFVFHFYLYSTYLFLFIYFLLLQSRNSRISKPHLWKTALLNKSVFLNGLFLWIYVYLIFLNSAVKKIKKYIIKTDYFKGHKERYFLLDFLIFYHYV